MTRHSRFVACAAIPALALSLGTLAPQWSRAAGLDFWNAPTLSWQIRAEAEEMARLNAVGEVLRTRTLIKRTMLADLVAGRATLREVTAQFLEMAQSDPAYLFVVRSSYHGRTDEERVARNVVMCALAISDPGEREQVRKRLEADLWAMTGCPDGIDPEPAAVTPLPCDGQQ